MNKQIEEIDENVKQKGKGMMIQARRYEKTI